MTENKLPEGVGKKIVEALKKQSEIEVTPIQETVNEAEVENLITDEVNDMFVEENEQLNQQAEETDSLSDIALQQPQQEYIYQQPQQVNYEQHYNEPVFSAAPQQPVYREVQPNYAYNENVYNEQPQAPYQGTKEFSVPSNVAVLKRLINQLPQGVSKQTGAQIIRQTMEALGISMSTVLTEAQNFQDGLNTAVRDCVSNIQEYKNNIKNLEKQVSDYQRQSAQVNDLISLFIMTDK